MKTNFGLIQSSHCPEYVLSCTDGVSFENFMIMIERSIAISAPRFSETILPSCVLSETLDIIEENHLILFLNLPAYSCISIYEC